MRSDPIRSDPIRLAAGLTARISWVPVVRYCDAHNHLQDDRFGGRQSSIVETCRSAGVVSMVVNGACEADWPRVSALAVQFPGLIIPSFGYHPWYIGERTKGWLAALEAALDDAGARVGVGEIGLDRWKPGLAYEGQEEVLLAQLEVAARRNLPVSIHCLQAWGRMLELLRGHPRPARGFLLHSYGGSREMVPLFAELGAYFSFPGYFAHPRKERHRAAFKDVPLNRLLVETDAPDQLPPEPLLLYRVEGADAVVNHPANIGVIQAYLADMLGLPPRALSERVETNFARLFGAHPSA